MDNMASINMDTSQLGTLCLLLIHWMLTAYQVVEVMVDCVELGPQLWGCFKHPIYTQSLGMTKQVKVIIVSARVMRIRSIPGPEMNYVRWLKWYDRGIQSRGGGGKKSHYQKLHWHKRVWHNWLSDSVAIIQMCNGHHLFKLTTCDVLLPTCWV